MQVRSSGRNRIDALSYCSPVHALFTEVHSRLVAALFTGWESRKPNWIALFFLLPHGANDILPKMFFNLRHNFLQGFVLSAAL